VEQGTGFLQYSVMLMVTPPSTMVPGAVVVGTLLVVVAALMVGSHKNSHATRMTNQPSSASAK
jgi:hypothetical protein